MEREVFSDPKVMELSRHFLLLRLDLTRTHPDQKRILEKHDIKGVPTVIFLNREGVEQKRLRIESMISKTDFIEKMKALLEASKEKSGSRRP
jgi:thiol:disulfide interchange protein DsbD